MTTQNFKAELQWETILYIRMKARLTNPKCIHLKRVRAIFDKRFTYILCNSLLSLMLFFLKKKITLARITLHTGRQVQENSQWSKGPQQS
jgi:hypothetical protein